MNETPGETPNPLANGQSAAKAENQPVQATAPAEPAQPAAPVETASGDATPQESPAEPKPKKKTGLIIGIIVAALLLIGGGVAAAIILINMNNAVGTVPGAMEKLMSGEVPANVAVDGDIIINFNDDNLTIKKIDIALDSDFATSSMVNTSSATVTLTSDDDTSVSATFDEVFVDGSDIYFKLDGIMKVLTDSKLLYMFLPMDIDEPVDCTSEDGDDIDCVEGSSASNISIEDILDAYGISDVVKLVDGEWLHVSMDEITNTVGASTDDDKLSCLSDLTNDINKNSSSAIEHYNNHPFIIATTENVIIPSKNYPVNKVNFDSEELSGYIDEIQNSVVLKNLYNCMGWNNNLKVNKDDVKKAVKNIPDLFVEIDNNNNFTRLYFEVEKISDTVSVIVDLSFKYPDTINATEPSNYKDFSDVIQEIFKSYYLTPQYEVVDDKVSL